MATRLIVNLGTSRVAWRGTAYSGVRVHGGEPGHCLVQAFADREPPREVVFGSVAARVATDELLTACRTVWRCEARELVAGREAYGVRNVYPEPTRLGVDRWAAMIAAYHVHAGAVLIADCGTAVTVDYVADGGRHVGGLISPGLGLMRRALASGTRLALTSELAPVPPLFGTDTELGVAGGALAAVAGFLAYVAGKTAARYGSPKAILITGGDASVVRARLSVEWSHAPELVLDGLELLADLEP